MVRESLLTKHEKKQHDQDRYKKNRADIPVAMKFGVVLIDNKNWFYKLSFKGQLLNNSHIDVIFYYLRKKAKYEVGSSYKYTTGLRYIYARLCRIPIIQTGKFQLVILMHYFYAQDALHLFGTMANKRVIMRHLRGISGIT
ncbi:hypothetical protein KY290_009488 [Solanum tuberosum]|uniref:Uncharacterized protein n=1 Tax=Solanum tuberosum TaxID=4113 RepID=A0ABQ7WBG1_SOLTU|nr:hypothetical protein KY290_009488 [Solanum tuberosum]